MTLRRAAASVRCGISVAIRGSRRCFSWSSPRANKGSMELTPMIGLEIHAQLDCATKLFSAVAVDDSAPSNSRVALFDMATPGTLPRLNQRSVEQCLRIARLLHCEIPQWCRFDRKHYFYPDMPLGYQITQKDHPIALEGFMDFYVYTDSVSGDPHKWKDEFPTYSKRIKIQRLQLEMDSGKLLKLYGVKGDDNSVAVTDSHNAYENDDVELVDLNRAGVPLAEIITAPELHSAHEAICFVEQLRAFLHHNRICTGDMHKGHLRVDANVSTSVNGEIGPKVEIKNLNSFRFLRNAIAFEIDRQRRVLSAGDRVEEETRCLDENHIKTVPMREKGEMLDYRFTPEVNLPRLQLKARQIEPIKVDPPHLEFIEKHGFPPAYVFNDVLKNEDLERFIRQLFNDTSKPICFDTFFDILNEFERICEQCGRHFPPKENLLLQTLRDAIVFESEGKLTRALCLDLLKLYASGMETHATLQMKMESDNLWRIHDEAEVGRMIGEVFADNGVIHSKARKAVLAANGKLTKRNKHLNKLRDEVVQRSGKRIAVDDAETHVIRRILRDK